MNNPRISLWDNTRFVAIVLVVVGHALTKTVAETEGAFVLYVTIYLFHIPLFVFLSGFFYSAEAPTPRRIQGVVVDVLIPYLIFETIWSVIHSIQDGHFAFNPLRPSWTLWFLLSLAAWRIMLPYLALVPTPLLVALVVAVWSGYWNVDQTLSLSRTLAFLPFFVLGWQAKRWEIDRVWLSKPPQSVGVARGVAGAWLLSIVVVVWWGKDFLRTVGVRKLLTADTSYAQAGFEIWYAGAIRVGLFLLATTMIIAFIVLMPRGQLWITALGAGTMTAYVLHSFILAPLRQTPLLSGALDWWQLPAVVFGSILLTVILAQPALSKILHPLVQPRWALSATSIQNFKETS